MHYYQLLVSALIWFCVSIFKVDTECGIPGKPKNGTFAPFDKSIFEVNDVVSYECDEGFALAGTDRRICEADGSWSDDIPLCLQALNEKHYSTNPPINTASTLQLWRNEYATLKFDISILGAISLKFQFVDSFQKCRNYHWQNERIFQNLLYHHFSSGTCSSNIIRLETSRYNIYWTYCNKTFFIPPPENSRSICGIKLYYSNISDSCGMPDQPPHSVLTPRADGTSFQYSCLPGYSLVGNQLISCDLRGFRSKTIPSCAVTTCPDVKRIEDEMYVTYKGNLTRDGKPLVNTTALYTCGKPGMVLVGESTRKCLENGTWSFKRPICNNPNKEVEVDESTKAEPLVSGISDNISKLLEQVSKETSDVIENLKSISITIICVLFVLLIAILIIVIIIMRKVFSRRRKSEDEARDATKSTSMEKGCDVISEGPDYEYGTDETTSIVYRQGTPSFKSKGATDRHNNSQSLEIYEEIEENGGASTCQGEMVKMNYIPSHQETRFTGPDLLKGSDECTRINEASNPSAGSRVNKQSFVTEIDETAEPGTLKKTSSTTPILSVLESSEDHHPIVYEDNVLYEESSKV